MADTVNYDAESAALRARLAQLARGRTKAEIARKTGTSITNVARYLAGTRMPTEFSVAVIKGLGVNPAWWLVGEGTPYVADITAGTTAMAGNLLELVEAMSAVSRMRLGALAQKNHLKVLRELNDALGTYERLRDRLNQQSRGIFEQLLADLDRSLENFKVQPAAELLKAAQQVARLCDAPDLHRQLLVQQARYYYAQVDFERALACQRRLVMHLLGDDGLATEQGCQNAVHLVLTL
ncbi:MAG: helix-turn-helix transcriptional regulator, partial [Planctomycetes bacterium]|nr:helix-turn-helix transcriptional regulator [Planctomycetota bacterium]